MIYLIFIQALASLPPGAELPEAFRPSEWLAQVVPKKSPYSPQMGDEVVFFKEGYQKYLVAVREKKVYDVGPRCEPYEKFNLQVKFQLMCPTYVLIFLFEFCET